MTDIQYVAPRTLDEAVAAFAATKGAGRILAGGTDLLVQMRNGVVTPSAIVDVKKIAEMIAIEETKEGGFKIGAAVPGATLRDHAKLRKAWPGVVEAANLIGSTQIQSRATAGGNLCNGSPAGDSVPAMIAAGAIVTIQGPKGRRELPVEKVPKSPGRLNLEPGEIVVSFTLPAGHSCPGARECLSRADRETGKIKDGKETNFRCFEASLECIFPSLRELAWHNFSELRLCNDSSAMATARPRSGP